MSQPSVAPPPGDADIDLTLSMPDASPVHSVHDLQPFLVDPLILARLKNRRVRPLKVGIALVVVVVLIVPYVAMLSDQFWRPRTAGPWWRDLWLFLTRAKSSTTGTSAFPFLRDYPSIVMAVTIAASVMLVYGLYRSAEHLHSDMVKSGCVQYTDEGLVALNQAVRELNDRFSRWGRRSPIALFLIAVAVVALNLRLQGRLHSFLGIPKTYDGWWASLHPFRPGAVLWVIFGVVGIYMVYVEAVVGLSYVVFLRKRRKDYRFRANVHNPDDFYGWVTLRQIVSNMEAGVVCTLVSAWAMSFFLQPALGALLAVATLGSFIAVVSYVFIGVTVNFRRQLREDRRATRSRIGAEIVAREDSPDIRDLIGNLIAYKQLRLIDAVPSSPIRQRWIVAGALSMVPPLSAICVQLIKYFTK